MEVLLICTLLLCHSMKASHYNIMHHCQHRRRRWRQRWRRQRQKRQRQRQRRRRRRRAEYRRRWRRDRETKGNGNGGGGGDSGGSGGETFLSLARLPWRGCERFFPTFSGIQCLTAAGQVMQNESVEIRAYVCTYAYLLKHTAKPNRKWVSARRRCGRRSRCTSPIFSHVPNS